nr:hypothetical protein [Prolixibacteraceae bacterium]
MRKVFVNSLFIFISIFGFLPSYALSIELAASEINDSGFAKSWYDIEVEVTITGESPYFLGGILFLDGNFAGTIGNFDSLEVVDYYGTEVISEGVLPCNTHEITYVLYRGAYGYPNYEVVQSASISVNTSCHNTWGHGDLLISSKEFYDDFVAPLNLVTVE